MKFKRVLRYIINLRQLVINLIYFCNRGQFVLLLKKGLVSLLCFNEQNSSIFCCLKVVSCKSMQTDILLRSPLQITSWCDILPFFLPHYCPFLLPRPCPHFPFLHRFYTQPPPPLFFFSHLPYNLCHTSFFNPFSIQTFPPFTLNSVCPGFFSTELSVQRWQGSIRRLPQQRQEEESRGEGVHDRLCENTVVTFLHLSN